MQKNLATMVLLVVLLTWVPTIPLSSALVVWRTYSSDADFDEGMLIGVEHETVHDQLQLSKEYTTLPFIWVPNIEGTVSKVETTTGKELGRYWVSEGADSNPSRTTVDLFGNCWVGNRQRGTVVKIGLFEAGYWIDRNSDGLSQTSQDTNDDGEITGDEILPWGEDECVLYEVVLVPGYEGVYLPGTYTGPYDYNYWGVSPRGLAIDANNNLWAGTWSTSKYFYIDGASGAIIRSVDVAPHNAYGAVIDENGILWSAEGPGGSEGHVLLRFDPSNDAQSFVNIGHTCYGLGLDYNHHLWASSYWNYKFSRIDIFVDPPTFVTYDAPEQYESRGVAATGDNSIWVANTGANTVTRYDNNGNLVATITGLYGPTGVAVDTNGKVWTTDVYDEYVHRIDPTTNMIDLSKQIVGSGGHYTYSDMTGIVARTITTKIGMWAVVFDSEAADTPWGTLSWNSYEPEGTSVTVKVRSSIDQITWSAWELAPNGAPLSATPNGRYLETVITLQIVAGEVSPILYDLTVQIGITHDVATIRISSSEKETLGESIIIYVTVENQGDATETFNVCVFLSIYANTTLLGSQTVTSLPPLTQTNLTFNWNPSGFLTGPYKITATAQKVLGEIDTRDNDLAYGMIQYRTLSMHTLSVFNYPPYSILLPFNINNTRNVSPWTGALEEDTYTITVPPTIIENETVYEFRKWEDDTTNPARTINLTSDKNIIAYYEPSSTPPVTIYASPIVTTMAPHEVFTIDINIADVTNLHNWETTLYYDTRFMDATAITEGAFLKVAGATAFSIIDWNDAYNQTHGRLRLSESLTSPSQGASGSGTLASIAFNATASGNSIITLGETTLQDPLLSPIPHSIIQGVGLVRVKLIADVNNDGVVDIFDCILVASSFGITKGTPPNLPIHNGYNPHADLRPEFEIIDIFDVIVIGSHFGEIDP